MSKPPEALQSFFDQVGPPAPGAGADLAAGSVAPETLPPGTPEPAAAAVPESAGVAGSSSVETPAPPVAVPPQAAAAPGAAPSDQSLGLQGVDPSLLQLLRSHAEQHPNFAKAFSLAALAMANPHLASQLIDNDAREVEQARALLTQLSGQEMATGRAEAGQARLGHDTELKARYQQINDIVEQATKGGADIDEPPTDPMDNAAYQKWVRESTKAVAAQARGKEEAKVTEENAKRLQEARGKATAEIRRYIDLGTPPDQIAALVPAIADMAGLPQDQLNPQTIQQLIAAGTGAASALAKEREAKQRQLSLQHDYLAKKLADMEDANKQAWARIANGKLQAGAQYLGSADLRMQQLSDEITKQEGFVAQFQKEGNAAQATAYANGVVQLKTQRDALQQNVDLMRNSVFENVMGNKPQVAFNNILSQRLKVFTAAYPEFFSGPDAVPPEVFLQRYPHHDISHSFWDQTANDFITYFGQNPAAKDLARNYTDALAFQRYGADVVDAFGDESTRSNLSNNTPAVLPPPPAPGGAEPPK